MFLVDEFISTGVSSWHAGNSCDSSTPVLETTWSVTASAAELSVR